MTIGKRPWTPPATINCLRSGADSQQSTLSCFVPFSGPPEKSAPKRAKWRFSATAETYPETPASVQWAPFTEPIAPTEISKLAQWGTKST
jgi:hypothetical protein